MPKEVEILAILRFETFLHNDVTIDEVERRIGETIAIEFAFDMFGGKITTNEVSIRE